MKNISKGRSIMPFYTHVMSKVILVLGSVNQTMKMGHCCGHGEATINDASTLMCCENKKQTNWN